jgi:hypothetical protein
MAAITAPSYITYQQEMTRSSIKAQLARLVRNWMIEQRIKRLEKQDVTPASWGSLTEAEREHHVRIISATRHAIHRMRKMLS